MDVNQLALTSVGWPNGEKLALTCVQIWSRPNWAQVNASARKPWPNEVASWPKFSICVYLRLRLARALISCITCFFSLLLEISSPATSMWDNLSTVSAFETAVHSPLERQDVQTLWTEYLFYQRSKASQSKQSMDELINRCLMSVSTHSSLPHSSSAVWQDYRFHNQVRLERHLMGTGLPEQGLSPEIIDCSQPKRPGSQPLCLRTQKKARVKRVQDTQGYLNILLTFQFFHDLHNAVHKLKLGTTIQPKYNTAL